MMIADPTETTTTELSPVPQALDDSIMRITNVDDLELIASGVTSTIYRYGDNVLKVLELNSGDVASIADLRLQMQEIESMIFVSKGINLANEVFTRSQLLEALGEREIVLIDRYLSIRRTLEKGLASRLQEHEALISKVLRSQINALKYNRSPRSSIFRVNVNRLTPTFTKKNGEVKVSLRSNYINGSHINPIELNNLNDAQNLIETSLRLAKFLTLCRIFDPEAMHNSFFQRDELGRFVANVIDTGSALFYDAKSKTLFFPPLGLSNSPTSFNPHLLKGTNNFVLDPLREYELTIGSTAYGYLSHFIKFLGIQSIYKLDPKAPNQAASLSTSVSMGQLKSITFDEFQETALLKAKEFGITIDSNKLEVLFDEITLWLCKYRELNLDGNSVFFDKSVEFAQAMILLLQDSLKIGKQIQKILNP